MMLAAALAVLLAQAPAVEECVVKPGQPTAASETFGGKTYRFATSECREVFLSDPERYAQLYDALAELAAAGKTADAPRDASLVPS
jgi:YHS domain-containing protein